MRCFICDGTIDKPKVDPVDLKTMPCWKCEEVIQETIESFRHPDEDMFAYIDSGEEENISVILKG